MENIIRKASVLVEAIPYIDQYRRKVFVIKYGGSILHDDVIRKRVLEDIIFLSFVGIRIILVHGGGPNISNRLKEMGIEPHFHNGFAAQAIQPAKVIGAFQPVSQRQQAVKHPVPDLINHGHILGLRAPVAAHQVKLSQAFDNLGYG